MSPSSRVWVVRGGDNNELAPQVKSKGAIAIGWDVVGDVGDVPSRDELRRRLEDASPGAGSPNAVGQLFRFVREIQQGDFVLTPEKATSTIHISRCTGAYRHDPTVYGEAYAHVRPLQFLKTVPRSVFPQTVRNTLGSVLTVFRADIALPYVESELGQAPSISSLSDAPTDLSLWADEVDGQARGQVLEAMDNIDHHDFQVFVAGLLVGLGYRAQVGAKGKDGGVDILAYRDVFGLESPRIKVQVKNQKGTAGIADVGYLNGVLGQGESGLFVCTGGFSKDAEAAPFVRSGRVALVDGTRLLELVVESYERLPVSASALLPLRKIYVPERPPA
jgi:restriction system protein